jgi:hypothetical protein
MEPHAASKLSELFQSFFGWTRYAGGDYQRRKRGLTQRWHRPQDPQATRSTPTERPLSQSPRLCSKLRPEKSACDQATAPPQGPVQGACTSKEGVSNPQRQTTLRTTLCKKPKACQVSPSSRGSPLSKTGQSHETKYSSGVEEFVCSPWEQCRCIAKLVGTRSPSQS